MSHTTSSGRAPTELGELPDPPAEVADRAWSPFDVLVAVAIVGTGAWWFHLTRGAYFFFDEWALALRGRSFGDLLQAYNGHLSITYLATYRVLFGIFGLDHYGVFRFVGIAVMLSVPTTLYLTTRRRVGPALAGVAACAVLWFHDVSLEPGGLNHPLTLTSAVVVAWLLRRSGRRNDWWVALALAAGLATSGGAVAITVAAVVHSVVSRAPWSRWAAIAAPTGAWAMWWLVEGRSSSGIPEELKLSTGEALETVVRGLFKSFESLAGGSPVAAWVVIAAWIGVAAWRLREGVSRSASLLAWSAGAVFWWAALVQNRGPLATPETFRYQFVAATLLLLALVPDQPHPIRRLSRSVPAQALAVGLALVALVASLDATRQSATRQNNYGTVARLDQIVASAVPPVVDPDHRYSLNLSALTQRDYQRVAGYYGAPEVPVDRLDRTLVDAGAISLTIRRDDGDRRCTVVDRPSPVRPPLVVRTGNQPARVLARQFGTELLPVGRVPPNSVATVGVRGYVPKPWTVVAAGACRPGP